MPLRTTDFTNIERFTDDGAWIELRVGGLSKGESDLIADLTTGYKVDAAALAGAGNARQQVEIDQKIADANRALFEVLCTGWSLELPTTGAAYASLDEESGRWVDEQIGKVLEKRRKRAEGKAPSSTKPKGRAGSSRRAPAST